MTRDWSSNEVTGVAAGEGAGWGQGRGRTGAGQGQGRAGLGVFLENGRVRTLPDLLQDEQLSEGAS